MAEHGLEHVSAWRRAPVRCDLMASVARSDLGLRRMTRVAVRMSLDTDRYRFSRTCRLMTRDAALRRATWTRVVCTMVKFHVESLDKSRREFLHGRRNGVHIAMADRAHHLLFGICELADVTADA